MHVVCFNQVYITNVQVYIILYYMHVLYTRRNLRNNTFSRHVFDSRYTCFDLG